VTGLGFRCTVFEMADKCEGPLPATVCATLNYVLHQEFYPDGVHAIDAVCMLWDVICSGMVAWERFVCIESKHWSRWKIWTIYNEPDISDGKNHSQDHSLEFLDKFSDLDKLSKDECWQ
jgi:hypothetical protein